MPSPILSSFSLSDNIIGFIIDGPYDELALDKVQQEIYKKLEVYEKVNFYIEDTINAEISLKTVLKNVPFKIKTANRFEKVAVVTDRKWLQFVSSLEKLFFNAELRIFPTERRLDAIQWITG